MIYFKACPRCHGDMHLSKDQYGQYVECIQCGYEVESQALSEMKRVPDASRQEEVVKVA
ncbi:MAG: hypothetical protein HY531_00805 [Chloroflexi bacterium]|nr:hypothetical protein [Chloroflexota bacterium]